MTQLRCAPVLLLASFADIWVAARGCVGFRSAAWDVSTIAAILHWPAINMPSSQPNPCPSLHSNCPSTALPAQVECSDGSSIHVEPLALCARSSKVCDGSAAPAQPHESHCCRPFIRLGPKSQSSFIHEMFSMSKSLFRAAFENSLSSSKLAQYKICFTIHSPPQP